MKEVTMSKQTSIEWFAEKDTELTIQFLEGKLNQIQLAIEKMQCLNKAKQMHKEEIEGAKWMQERMYSEEDLKEAFRQGQDNMDYSDTYGWSCKLTEKEWFEQFKNRTTDTK